MLKTFGATHLFNELVHDTDLRNIVNGQTLKAPKVTLKFAAHAPIMQGAHKGRPFEEKMGKIGKEPESMSSILLHLSNVQRQMRAPLTSHEILKRKEVSKEFGILDREDTQVQEGFKTVEALLVHTPDSTLPKGMRTEEEAIFRKAKRAAAIRRKHRLARHAATLQNEHQETELRADTGNARRQAQALKQRLQAVHLRLVAEQKKLQHERTHPFSNTHTWTLATENADMNSYFDSLQQATVKNVRKVIATRGGGGDGGGVQHGWGRSS